MNRHSDFRTALTVLVLAGLACGSSTAPSQPSAPIAPIPIGSDLTGIDVCQAIPQADIEAVMGRKLITTPQHFTYYDTTGTSGCSYDGGKDSSGEAHFGYVALTPVDVYSGQPLYQNVAVSGLGDAAYFNNGADARQLWVKVDNKAAFVVAFGDVPREDGAKAIAQLLVAALK